MNNAQATKQCLKKNNLIIIRRRDTIRMKMARQETENGFFMAVALILCLMMNQETV